MSYKQDLLYRSTTSIATITLNRPERMNALTHDLEAELHRASTRRTPIAPCA